MNRVAIAIVIALLAAATASAALITGRPGQSDRITGRTDQPDRIFAGRGDDVVFARDQRADYVNCGPGHDVAVLDRIDRAVGCEVKRYPPRPVGVTPSPVGVIEAGPPGSVIPLPKRCRPKRRCLPSPTPVPEPEPEPLPQPGPPGASGVPMPTGDLPGWHLIFSDDFTTDLASWGSCTSYDGGRDCPGLPAAYRSKWWAYPSSYQDTREKISGDGGFYQPSAMSMSGGMLVLPLRRSSGTSQSEAPIPKIPGNTQTYGRYAIRFQTTSSDAFKIAWLLWRTSASWGEIDFPEADLDGTISAFNHHPSGQAAFDTSTPVAGAWHTAVTEWRPGSVSFFLDGVKVGEDTGAGVPSTPMTWVIQSETRLGGSLPAVAAADIHIDWVAVWSAV